MTAHGYRTLVIGAGIGGIGAAIALAQEGHEVEVIDIRRPQPLAGVGIDQPGNSLRMLDTLGVLGSCLEHGFAYGGNSHFTGDGQLIVRLDSDLGDERVPANLGLSRQDLRTALVDRALELGVSIRYECTVQQVEDDGGHVHVNFSDGSRGVFDLVAAFDGIRSDMRDRLFGDSAVVEKTGFSVWRVTLPRAEEVDRALIFHGHGSSVGVIPISPEGMYLFHVAPTPDSAGDDLSAELAAHLADYGGLVGRLAEQIPGRRVIHGHLEEVRLPRWAKGRIIVLGDAAHASVPTLTQGAAMALEDGVVLARALGTADTVEQALLRTEEARQPRAGQVQAASRGILAAEMAVQGPDEAHPGLEELAGHLEQQVARIEGLLNQSPWGQPVAHR